MKYDELVKALRYCAESGDFKCGKDCPMHTEYPNCLTKMDTDAAAAIEALQAEVKRLQGKLCDWCAVCPKERRNPDDCELIGENPVMYVPSGAKMGGTDERRT